MCSFLNCSSFGSSWFSLQQLCGARYSGTWKQLSWVWRAVSLQNQNDPHAARDWKNVILYVTQSIAVPLSQMKSTFYLERTFWQTMKRYPAITRSQSSRLIAVSSSKTLSAMCFLPLPQDPSLIRAWIFSALRSLLAYMGTPRTACLNSCVTGFLRGARSCGTSNESGSPRLALTYSIKTSG